MSKNKKVCRDHLGNVYASKKDMCDFYKIKLNTFYARISQGWDLETALTTTQSRREKSCVDHLGNAYPSKQKMCEFYKITADAFDKRISKGLDLETALTTPLCSAKTTKKCSDHLGNVYASKKDMCNFYGINVDIFNWRISKGWDIKTALTTPKNKVFSDISCSRIKTWKDHLGNTYSSKKGMCDFYGISVKTFNWRISKGWDVKTALTTPLYENGRSAENTKRANSYIDHNGNAFSSKKEMCDFYGITLNTFYGRIRYGWDIEAALTTPQGVRGKRAGKTERERIYIDHLGNTFSSKKEMCEFHGTTLSAFKNRRYRGWDIERALTTPNVKTKIACEDHFGNAFASKTEMCNFYGITVSIFDSRISKGWDVETALTTPKSETSSDVSCSREKLWKDHLGNTFSGRKEICDFYGITVDTFKGRIALGWDMESVLTTPNVKDRRVCKDHLGNVFSTQKEMCECYGISKDIFKFRISHGWGIEKTLTTPVNSRSERSKVCKDHLGNTFSSRKEMCDFYKINIHTFLSRIYNGMDIETALSSPICFKPKKTKVEKNNSNVRMDVWKDHLGNTYPTRKEMCNFYNIKIRTFENRRALGWDMEKILTTPVAYRSERTKVWKDHLGNIFSSRKEMCKFHGISESTYVGRKCNGWSLEEILTVPKRLYIGEYRVAECLKRLNVKFYHDCSIKTIFKELDISIDWNDFLAELQTRLGVAGYNWSKKKIQRLRPDFVLYTDKDNKIRGVVEFDGTQHQNFVEFFFKTIEEFFKRSDVDFIKQSFWEYLNIPMLRIRYDQIDMIDEMVVDFIDNPQNYISNHNTYLSEDEYWSILVEQKAQVEMAFAS